ncbi:heat-inducible transcriptional repressor HrcA [soil metagenome]
MTEREQIILRAIVHLYILHATPVGSGFVATYLERELKLSPATIRAIMADLEDKGFITHPHTSAGRMPTDKGYRFYVDSLMDHENVSNHDADAVRSNLLHASRESILRDASRVLGSLSHYLALVQMPQLANVVVRKVEMIPLSSERILVVIALESDIVRTLTIETQSLTDYSNLDEISRYINERSSGRSLNQLASVFPEMTDNSDERALIRLFVDQVSKLQEPASTRSDTIHVAGAQNLIAHPEFDTTDRLRSVIELVENEDVIIHLFGTTEENGVRVRIGNELANEHLQDYSLISTTYKIGAATGSVGLIGPKRMNYARMVSLVEFVSNVITSTYGGH